VDPAVAAAARGLHVLTEKPLGITVAECRRAAAACRAAGVLLGVTYTYHFIPDFRGMRERVDRGEIGAVREVRWLKFGGPPAEPDPVPPPPLPAHHQLARIPHLFDCGVHAFDLMSWLAGAPMVQVWGQAAAAGPGHEPESVVIVFTYADGQRGVYQMGPMTALPGADSGQPALSFHVIGTAGSLLWDYRVGWSQRQGYTTITAHTAAGTSIEQIPIYGKARDLQYAEFAAAVRAGALPGHWPTPEQAVEATRMGVEACAAIARNTVCLSDYPQPTGARRP
jgi:predicted dehydrogenase